MAEKRFSADVFAWFGNVSSSVLLIYCNKYLMSSTVGHGFRFATTLCALHYLTCSAGTLSLRTLGYVKKTSISRQDLLIFTLAANLSIVSLNLSLMLNSVGVYQIAKLCIIPCSCLVEAYWLQRRYTAPVIASVLLVLLGVAIVTVTDLSLSSNLMGTCAAAISVLSSTLQQIFCRTMQQRNNLAFLEFLSHTAPAQALTWANEGLTGGLLQLKAEVKSGLCNQQGAKVQAEPGWTMQGWSLIFVGPFVDYFVGGSWLLSYRMGLGAALALIVSCSVAIGVNVSQFACLGRFQAVSFQVLGHTKTVLVLLGGWAFLGDKITGWQLLGMVTAVAGMVLYGFFTSKKAGSKRTTELDEDSNDKISNQRDDGRITLASHASQRRGPVAKIASNV